MRPESFLDAFPQLGVEWRTPKSFALATSAIEARTNSLLDHRPLELGKDFHHAE